jgi:iron complex outermembrane receptor protein
MTKRSLLLTCALGALTAAPTGVLAAAAAASDNATTTLTELVITAEKREQSLQTVPIAVSAYTAARRELIGVNSIQDMTNFTPGLQYNTSTDRISLRGVGRLTNVLSADASVANYNDGVYETFAVAAGRSTLLLDRVEILRGPQGTLYGRNAIGGAINEISRRPTKEPYAEVRFTYGNYNHSTLEGAFSGSLTDNIQIRLAGNWEKQTHGWSKNIIPGHPDEGNVINEWYVEGQLQIKFSDHLDMWTKIAGGKWSNGAGGPGSASGGWTPAGYATWEYGNAAVLLNPGYGCSANVSNVQSPLPLAQACANPALSTPWKIARYVPYAVKLPEYTSVASHWTWHADGFDIKYVTGGVHYHYILTGPTQSGIGAAYAPITAYTLPSFLGPSLVINPISSFNYQEDNGFWSHEINILSTNDSPLQWLVGAYYFRQHYRQPVTASEFAQPEMQTGQPIAAGFGSSFCFNTNNACAPADNAKWFDNRPDVRAISEAIFGQIDWKMNDQLKITLGLRYSHDKKFGTESVRLLCFAVPACLAGPELNPFFAIRPVDLTQIPSVVDASNPMPKGVTTVTRYDAATGFATRNYSATWGAVTGSASIDWTPDADTLFYAKYARGYKSGGYNIGIFTVLSFSPWTDAEHVDSFEIGMKKTFGHMLTTNLALFHYAYNNLQIPISVVNSGSGSFPATSGTQFYNVPKAVSQGVELETTWAPIDHLLVLFNYSYLDAHITQGRAVDFADPAALDPAAKPLVTQAQCIAGLATNLCALDGGTTYLNGYTSSLPNGGFVRNQDLKGNILPNSPRHKVAFNVTYTFENVAGGKLSPSLSYVWRSAQYGNLFTRAYNRAPSWAEVDGRITYTSANERFVAIAFVKNLFNQIGYDSGAYGTRLAGSVDDLNGTPTNFVQGVNGGTAVPGAVNGVIKTYSITPPRTYGIELHYKFF